MAKLSPVPELMGGKKYDWRVRNPVEEGVRQRQKETDMNRPVGATAWELRARKN